MRPGFHGVGLAVSNDGGQSFPSSGPILLPDNGTGSQPGDGYGDGGDPTLAWNSQNGKLYYATTANYVGDATHSKYPDIQVFTSTDGGQTISGYYNATPGPFGSTPVNATFDKPWIYYRLREQNDSTGASSGYSGVIRAWSNSSDGAVSLSSAWYSLVQSYVVNGQIVSSEFRFHENWPAGPANGTAYIQFSEMKGRPAPTPDRAMFTSRSRLPTRRTFTFGFGWTTGAAQALVMAGSRDGRT